VLYQSDLNIRHERVILPALTYAAILGGSDAS
jgi:hypothetical protein